MITDDSIFSLSASLQNLSELDLAYCKAVTSYGVQELKACTHMESITLAGCGLGDDIRLGFSNLKSINLKGLSALGDETIVNTVIGEQLEYLNVAEVDIGDDSIGHLIEVSLVRLEYLNLSWCEAITPASLSLFLSKLISLKVAKLRSLNLSDPCLSSLLDATSHLEVLDIARSEISDASVLHIARACPKLQVVNLCWSMIGDEGLKALLRSCRGLTSINLEGCKSLTPAIASYIPASASKNLMYLDLSWINCVSDEIVGAILKAFAGNIGFKVVDYYGDARCVYSPDLTMS